jgi:Mn-containing catalase
VHQDELLKLLTDIAAERLALLQRHEAGARVVSHYDFNNTYQYIINREETHLQWLQNALAEFGASQPPASSSLPVPESPKPGKKVDVTAFRNILEDDARGLNGFVQKWRDRVQQMTHVRHRNMVNVILGESLEHARMFEQAAQGFEDVLGRRTGGVARVGAVLPARWME